MQEFQAISAFFGLIGILFIILAFLLLRKGINEINFFFILGVIALAISSFICMLAFGGFMPNDLKDGAGIFGNILMFWAPVFFFISGMIILYGSTVLKTFKSLPSYVVFGLTGLYLIITLIYVLGGFELSRALVAGASVLVFGLLVNIIIYYLVYKEIPEQRNNLTFLLLGMIVSVVAVVIQVASNPTQGLFILPMEFDAIPGFMINAGILIFTLAFTSIPRELAEKVSIG